MGYSENLPKNAENYESYFTFRYFSAHILYQYQQEWWKEERKEWLMPQCRYIKAVNCIHT